MNENRLLNKEFIYQNLVKSDRIHRFIKIVATCGYGDVEDVLFEDDKQEVGHLGSWFFEEVKDE